MQVRLGGRDRSETNRGTTEECCSLLRVTGAAAVLVPDNVVCAVATHSRTRSALLTDNLAGLVEA